MDLTEVVSFLIIVVEAGVKILCILGSAILATSSLGQEARPAETPPLAFVTEYVRQLAQIEDTRAQLEQEYKKAAKEGPQAAMREAIYVSTRVQLELRDQIARLQGIHLSKEFDFIVPGIINFDEQKIGLHQRIIEIAEAFVEGPKPDVDYGKLSAEMPKVRAELDQTDHNLMEVVPGILMTLVDQRADSKGHCSHLLITKAEAAKLLADLRTYFGTKLEEKNPPYLVGSAQIMKDGLLKQWKYADDPWE
jgi:hypothetical protein